MINWNWKFNSIHPSIHLIHFDDCGQLQWIRNTKLTFGSRFRISNDMSTNL